MLAIVFSFILGGKSYHGSLRCLGAAGAPAAGAAGATCAAIDAVKVARMRAILNFMMNECVCCV
jgi:hypothetical protein